MASDSASDSGGVRTEPQSFKIAGVSIPTLSEYTFLASTVNVTLYVPSPFFIALASFALFL